MGVSCKNLSVLVGQICGSGYEMDLGHGIAGILHGYFISNDAIKLYIAFTSCEIKSRPILFKPKQLYKDTIHVIVHVWRSGNTY